MPERDTLEATTPLRVLVVKLPGPDADSLIAGLTHTGVALQDFCLVQTRSEFVAALDALSWDLVLADFQLPRFNALEALAVLRERGSTPPLLVISDRVGEESGVELVKLGASDFLVKGPLQRMAPAIARALGEVTQVTHARQAETELRASESKFRGMVELANEGVWLLDTSLQTTYANRRLGEMLGVSPEQIIGRPASDFLEGSRAQHSEASPEAVAEEDLLDLRQHCRREFRLRRADQLEQWAMVSSSPILDSSGTPTGILALVMDVTEQRALQSQLLVSDRMASVGLLAAGVAHEINNPLAVTLANLDLLRHDLKSLQGETAEGVLVPMLEELQDAHDAARRVATIVRDLRMFSRSGSEDHVSVRIEEVLESCLRMAASELRNRATVKKSFSGLPPVDASEARLGQVFLNLLLNAAHAIAPGQPQDNEIEVAACVAPDGRVCIEIKDTGQGIPPEHIRRLFTPFFTTKPVGVGTGLGLSISQGIIAALGGEILVNSQVGKGSTFTVLLPQGKTPTGVAPPAPSLPPTSARRARILIVDDENQVRAAVARSLGRYHDVVTARGGAEALSALGQQQFDLVLCDIMMPEMNGAELFAEVERLAPERAAKFVFLTGGVFTQELRAFLERFEGRVLEKPFSVPRLLELVEHMLRLIGSRPSPPEAGSAAER